MSDTELDYRFNQLEKEVYAMDYRIISVDQRSDDILLSFKAELKAGTASIEAGQASMKLWMMTTGGSVLLSTVAILLKLTGVY